jgi:hypothetical protein
MGEKRERSSESRLSERVGRTLLVEEKRERSSESRWWGRKDEVEREHLYRPIRTSRKTAFSPGW